MKFWDSSAIIPLCLREPRTSLVEKILHEDSEMVAWWGTLIEGFSAFARLRREEILDEAEEHDARYCLMQWVKEWTEVESSNQVRENAARVLLLHPLRAADSLQLASALVWSNCRVPCDYIPERSYPLFRAKDVLAKRLGSTHHTRRPS